MSTESRVVKTEKAGPEMTSMELQLSRYYKRKGISPEDFRCPHQVCCESYCTSGNFQTPNEGVRVSGFYQDRAYLSHHIPRIVVISLSAPVPNIERDENNGPLNRHWRETLAMVRSLLNACLEEDLPERAIRIEDNSTRQVEKLFVHLRTAKCSSQQEAGGFSFVRELRSLSWRRTEDSQAKCNNYARILC